MKSDLVDLMLALHHKTDKAILVSETGEEAKAVWLPLSAIEIEETKRTATGTAKGGQPVRLPLITVTLPERLAIEKRLV